MTAFQFDEAGPAPGMLLMTMAKRPPIDLDDETERLSPAGNDSEWWLLVVQEGVSVAHRLRRGKPILIGRSEECDVRIDDPSISRRHAQLLIGPPPCIQDLGSANGVRVARRPIEPNMLTPVEPGQAIELGAVVAVLHRPSMLPRGTVRASTLPGPDRERPSMLPGGPALVRDPAMADAMALASRVARSELAVLLMGETGVGKEIVAAAVHEQSKRADGPFVKVNCAALAESIVESELFGHEKGAFTGAVSARGGLFEAGHGGTVFLDEVGELSPAMQAKLLRVLETREVTRVGSVTPRTVDVRFISATNRDLPALCNTQRFREDLYYRLNGITIDIPPLRERPADIVPLAQRFARRVSSAQLSISPRAEIALRAYRWPGNVRQLRNVMERAAILAGTGAIQLSHLPAEVCGAETTVAEDESSLAIGEELEDIERRRIIQALEETRGNQTKAAALIGMPRRTFVKRLDAYGIARPRKGRGDS